MANLYEYSTPELVRLLGKRFKEYRMRLNLTQKDVAEQSGIGLTTISKFESGTAGNLSLSTVITLLKVIGRVNSLDDLMPELPESPYLIRKKETKAQRIRHSKKYVISKNKEAFSLIEKTGISNLSQEQLTSLVETCFKL